MGKATKRVTIIITEPEMLEWAVFKKMSEQGHQIQVLADVRNGLHNNPDEDPPLALVMGPRAHMLLPGMEACVPVALKKARVELYPAKEANDESA